MSIQDSFWNHYVELAGTQVIPYQWEALNDRVPGAAKSYCIRNFKLAAKVITDRNQGKEVPVFSTEIFNRIMEGEQDEGCFYGFLFQDTDLYKWVEAVSYYVMIHPDSPWKEHLEDVVSLIEQAQEKDGYLDTFYSINDINKRFTNLRNHHEFYCFGHLAEASVAYYQSTGNDRLLLVADRFCNCLMEHFGLEEGKKKGYPGHEIAEMALMRMYDVTGKKKYQMFATYLLEQRGQKPYYFDEEQGIVRKKNDVGTAGADGIPRKGEEPYAYQQAHRPVKKQEEAVGHAVRAMYLYSGMAALTKETHDQEMFAACKALWNSAVHEKMYITGGVGSTGLGEAFTFPYDLPNDTVYAETCASIGLVFFAKRMLSLEADSEYADVMERALYNGVLSGMAADGKSFFYVNPLSVLPEACEHDPGKFHVKSLRQKWFGCACCPPNLARLLTSIEKYVYGVKDNQVFQHLYINGEYHIDLDNQVWHSTEEKHCQVTVAVNGNLMDGRIHIDVKNDSAKEIFYALRTPAWCDDFTVSGAKIDHEKKGYAYISCQAGETLSLDVTIVFSPRFMESHDDVRENAGKVALTYGPVVYCLEEVDNGRNLDLLRVVPENIKIESGIPGITSLPVITVKGLRRKERPSGVLYHIWTPAQQENVTLQFVPYHAWNNRGVGEMQVWVRI